ncbi:MAG TPA: hypothetical protein VKK79_13525 [Candidatus Lokiarchaeia archaeon]|nr:hypothetical protein [Candidatus Lokiarchaeia archaeon]
MKGIAVIAYTKSPGAYIDFEYPPEFTSELNFESVDVMNLYALNRRDTMEPSFLGVTIKGISIAAFYSGFDFRHYIGRPDYIIAVFLERGENPNKYEEPLRQLARDLLPRREEEMFAEILQEAYKDLQAGLIQGIGPDEEIRQEDAYQRTKVSERDRPPAPVLRVGTEVNGNEMHVEVPAVAKKNVSELLLGSLEEINTQFKSMELDDYKNRVKELEDRLAEKEAKVRELSDVVPAECVSESEITGQVNQIRQNYEDLVAQKDEEINTWKSKTAEMNERAHIAEATIGSMNDIVLQTQTELQEQSRTIGDLKAQIQALGDNSQQSSSAIGEGDHSGEIEGDLALKEEEINALREKIKQLTADTNEDETAFKEMDATIQEKDREIVKLNHKISTLLKKIEEMGGAPCEEVPAFDTSSYDNEIAALRENLQTAEENVKKRDARLEEQKQEIIELKKTNKINRREIETIRKQIEG